jgi:hypothetical protein
MEPKQDDPNAVIRPLRHALRLLSAENLALRTENQRLWEGFQAMQSHLDRIVMREAGRQGPARFPPR